MLPRGFRWWVLTLVVFVAFGGAEVFTQDAQRSSNARVASVVGKWVEAIVEGEPVIRGEGATGSVDGAAIAALGASMFGQVLPVFVSNATAPAAFALGVVPDAAPLLSGTFSAQFNLVSGASDQTAGLVFDLQPSGEYLFVRYNTREGNVALWRYADGKREVVARAATKVQLPLGQWHRISLTISGTRIVGEVNDTLRLEHDLGRVPNGRIGFWTKRDSVTMFKRIVVQPER